MSPRPLPCTRLPAGLGTMPTAEALTGIPLATDALTPPLGMRENLSNPSEEPSGTCPAATMCVICCQEQATQEHQPRALAYTSVRDSHQFPSSLLKRSAGGSILTCPSSCRNSECPWAAHNKRVTCQTSREPQPDIATWVECFATYVRV